MFLNIPARGHVNPTLPLVRDLVVRGEAVTYCLPAEDEDLIRPTGARFRAVGDMLPEARTRQAGSTPLSELPAAAIRGATRVLPELLEVAEVEQPSYLVYDAYCVAGRILGQLLGLPAVATYPTYAFNEQALFSGAFGRLSDADSVQSTLAGFDDAVAELVARFDVVPPSLFELLCHAEPLNIVFVPREFHPAGDTFDDRWVFVGPSLPASNGSGDLPFDLADDRRLLYICLGTIYNNRPRFFRACLEAFAGSAWRVAVATGDWVDPDQLGAVPDNVVLRRWFPQLGMLRRAQVFVTHGGMNSVMEAIVHGVPMVVVPQQAEQVLTAERVAELGLGRHLDPAGVSASSLLGAVSSVAELGLGRHLDPAGVSASSLLGAVSSVAADPGVARHLAGMQEAALAGGGSRRAAEEILRFAARGSAGRRAEGREHSRLPW